MQTYELLVRSRAIEPNGDDTTLVRTSIGVDSIHVKFDNAEWLEFPVTVTYGNGDTTVTQAASMSAVDGSDEWYAQCTAPVPHEVLRRAGPLRVTFQGTDANGNHIVTAKGAPLTVEEAGDVTLGSVPEDAPTVDQWNQAYAQAVAAANDAATLVESLQARLETMVSDAEDSFELLASDIRRTATTERTGLVQVGDGLEVTESGILSVLDSGGGLTAEQTLQLGNLASLASECFVTSFADDGTIEGGSSVRLSALPIASTTTPGLVRPDGTSIRIDPDGFIRTLASFSEYTATVDQTVGTPSVDVETLGDGNAQVLNFAFSGIRGEKGDTGEKGDKGDKGDTGERGPSGYVLTQEDIETISGQIIAQYQYGDGRTY